MDYGKGMVMMSKIFVYGSLRQGGGLHECLATSKYLNTVRTKPEYKLYSLGAFPGLVAGGTTAVVGEVYDVTPEVLARLDRVEGHPNFYCRTTIILQDDTEVQAYLLPNNIHWSNNLIDSGDWIEFCGARR